MRPSCLRVSSLLFAVFTFAGNIPSLFADEAASQAREGVKAYEKQDYEAAIRAFRRASDLSPETPDYQFNLGTALARRDRYDEAEAALRKAAETEAAPSPDAAYNLAYAIAQGTSAAKDLPLPEKLAKMREAVEGFRQAVIADPKDRDAKYNLETARLLLRELEEQMRQQQQQQQGDSGEKQEDKQQQQEGESGNSKGEKNPEENQAKDQNQQQEDEAQPKEGEQEGQGGEEKPQNQSSQQQGLEKEPQPTDQSGQKQEEEKGNPQQDGQEQDKGMEQQKQQAGQQAKTGGDARQQEPQEGLPTQEQLDALRVLNALADTKPEQFKKLFKFRGQRQSRERDW